MAKKIDKKYYDNLINDYVDGKTGIKGDHPKEVNEAIDTFFHAGKILVDHPEAGKIPAEYVEKLLASLAKYPEYHGLLVELVGIIQKGEEG
tara:strand:+ start:1230 stop:1502 length:273 start_codon:yes stop_codon:yes gene_type:complete